MAKDIVYGQENREMILAGAGLVADSVRITLGPKGRNVLVAQDQGGAPLITNDGVTIAKSIDVKDRVQNIGAQLLKEAASKTNDAAGDGTTTATILAHSMLSEACRNIAAGASPVELRKGMQMAGRMAVACIGKMARPVSSTEDLIRIASISAKDRAAGELIASALEQSGPEGVVTIEESMQPETTLTYEEGIVFERGYLNPGMITDTEHQLAELYDPYILITDYKLDNPMDLVPIVEMAYKAGKPLLIIAEGVEPSVMGFFLLNKEKNGINTVAILPPLYGEGRQWRLEDLAVQTGGTFISKNFGLTLRSVTEEMLGGAEFVRTERMKTTILGAKGDPKAVETQIQMIRHLVETTDYEFNRKRYQERLAKFVSGVALIRVGGTTEVEMKEQKLRLDDAYHAAKAALEEGIVPGGGTTLVDIMPPIKSYMNSLEGDKRTGTAIVLHALSAPMAQIAENAGLDGSVVVGKVKELPRGTGFDAEDETYTDMIDAGIIDPARVVRLAVQASVSVVCTLLTSEASVSDMLDIQSNLT